MEQQMSGNTENVKLSRRMMTKDGWVYFCTLCGDYRPESSFYKQNNYPSRWGLKSSCKLHREPKQKDNGLDKRLKDNKDDMAYFRLHNVTEKDFQETQRFLESIGYDFSPGADPVYVQFIKKHPELMYK